MGNTTGMTSFVCDHASVKWILSMGESGLKEMGLVLIMLMGTLTVEPECIGYSPGL